MSNKSESPFSYILLILLILANIIMQFVELVARWLGVGVILFLASSVFATEKSTPEKLQDVSVTVRAGNAQGSGVIVIRGTHTYILTAGHVVARLRHETNSTQSYFDDAEVVQELIEGGRKVGVLSFVAKVVSYSKAEKPGEDLAILELYKQRAYERGVEFASVTPTVGTRLFHCGSLYGQFGSNSLTSGIMSQIGRVLEDTVYDQTSCTAFPGSSGGGVFTEDGKYVGMVVRGSGEGFNFIVPVRRIRAWTTRVNASFILDPTKPITVPMLEEKGVTPCVINSH